MHLTPVRFIATRQFAYSAISPSVLDGYDTVSLTHDTPE